MNEKIYVVLVTYNPNIGILNKCVDSLIAQVEKIIIVDNTPSGCKELSFFFNKNIEIIFLNENMGIAYAQNIGIKKAIYNGAEFVITSDQDTVYPDNYVEGLMRCFIENSKIKNLKIASISPLYRDLNKEKTLQPMVYFKNGFLKKDYTFKGCKSVSHVISSGMLISVNALNDIGLMNESLFIDWVDTEWCWRAILRGYSVLQTSNVVISHRLGNQSKKVFGKSITAHNSLRNYYKIRNAVYLLFHNNNLSFCMKFYTLQQILKMMIVHLLNSNKKNKENFMMFKGIKDGLFSKISIRK